MKYKDQDDYEDNFEDFEEDFEDQIGNFMEDIAKCDNRKRCGKSSLLEELSSCICQSFWSKNSDPSGRLCPAIPRATRMKAVKVISMFIKENGPAIPMNYTVLDKLGKLGDMWGRKFEKFFSMPFERKDMKVWFQFLSISLKIS